MNEEIIQKLSLSEPTPSVYQENEFVEKEIHTSGKIHKVFDNLRNLLLYKNTKYGDSALHPKNIFSKLSGEEAIKVRLDDKVSRIINSEEIRKNDVADVMGYLGLLCISKGWLSFEEFKD
jgi:hypothetical protein